MQTSKAIAVCRGCLNPPFARRSFSSLPPRLAPPADSSPSPEKRSPPPSPSPSTSTPRPVHPSVAAAQTFLDALKASTRTRARALSEAIDALELRQKLRDVGGKVNQATGYEEIELLRRGVSQREKALVEGRKAASTLKKAYSEAVAVRASSQREVNDLLQRKSSWTSADVMRFTDLVQRDHENEQTETRAKAAMDAGEEIVEKGFSDLMQAILERYHEEQIWSDKIRSLSTYGSLAITSLNVLLFVLTLLLIEPWKRKRLVEGVETRLRENTNASAQATQASLASLESLLRQSQDTLDLIYHTALPPATHEEDGERTEVQGADDPAMLPLSEGDPSSQNGEERDAAAVKGGRERERELWIVGAGGVMVGVGLSLLTGLIGLGGN